MTQVMLLDNKWYKCHQKQPSFLWDYNYVDGILVIDVCLFLDMDIDDMPSFHPSKNWKFSSDSKVIYRITCIFYQEISHLVTILPA
mmetsp:Transcript_25790/g.40590  ORF Transcript_25790/g.40590 Transcript_25790/m.40590 type:complete len:86 (-) Transcript_25790:370-627(-)